MCIFSGSKYASEKKKERFQSTGKNERMYMNSFFPLNFLLLIQLHKMSIFCQGRRDIRE